MIFRPAGSAADDATTTKARYALTHDGGTESLQLVRTALWQVDQWDSNALATLGYPDS